MAYENYIWEKHEGLYRFFPKEKKVFYRNTGRYQVNGKNLAAGKVAVKSVNKTVTTCGMNVHVQKFEMHGKEYSHKGGAYIEWDWNYGDHWAYDPESGAVYRVHMDANSKAQLSKEIKGYVAPHTSFAGVQQAIEDHDFLGEMVTPTRSIVPMQYNVRKLSIDYDNKPLFQLMLEKKKMSAAELTNLIVNEGGSVDSNGIIHRA